MSARHSPDDFISVRGAFRSCVSAVVIALAAAGSVGGPRLSSAAEPCSAATTPEQVQATLRESTALQIAEAELRRHRFGPGVIVPPNLEIYR